MASAGMPGAALFKGFAVQDAKQKEFKVGALARRPAPPLLSLPPNDPSPLSPLLIHR
jgi:hypothetical protein